MTDATPTRFALHMQAAAREFLAQQLYEAHGDDIDWPIAPPGHDNLLDGVPDLIDIIPEGHGLALTLGDERRILTFGSFAQELSLWAGKARWASDRNPLDRIAHHLNWGIRGHVAEEGEETRRIDILGQGTVTVAYLPGCAGVDGLPDVPDTYWIRVRPDRTGHDDLKTRVVADVSDLDLDRQALHARKVLRMSSNPDLLRTVILGTLREAGLLLGVETREAGAPHHYRMTIEGREEPITLIIHEAVIRLTNDRGATIGGPYPIDHHVPNTVLKSIQAILGS